MVTYIPYNMNIAIPPTVQYVVGTGAIATLKPFSLLRKKSAVGVGSARRALTTLGVNNAQINLKMAKSHLALSQEEFLKTWNFNPVKEVPLPSGRYQWSPITSGSDNESTSAHSVEVPNDITLLKDITNTTLATSSPPSVTSVATDLLKSKQDNLVNNNTVTTSTTKHGDCDNEDTSDCENRKQGSSPRCEKVLVSKKKVLSKSQIFITDFFKPQKRKSSYQCEDSQPNTSSKKKLRTAH